MHRVLGSWPVFCGVSQPGLRASVPVTFRILDMLKHTVLQGPALTHGDVVTELHSPEKPEQVHRHTLVALLKVTVPMDVPEMVPVDDNSPSPLYLALHTRQDLPSDGVLTSKECFLSV